ncbi:MAG: helix-turn-helix domain containing protein, partial [Desulfobacteraceae bacterium]|nr:helix-turn-helix domain containing protein [Desulfobacteraceae bacterium]
MAKEDKRNNIILAAMTLIAEQGFYGTSMSMIAEKAGVGIGTIYRYFEDLEIKDYAGEERSIPEILYQTYQ